MKRYLPLLLSLLAGFAASAQKHIAVVAYDAADSLFMKHGEKCDSCGCSNRPPATLVPPWEASWRVRAYQNRLSECKLSMADEVAYDKDGAIALLKKLTSNSGCDGFRAYFAIYPCRPNSDSGYKLVPDGQGGKLTLIYVPTTLNGVYTQNGKDHPRHLDDTTHCMIIRADSVEEIHSKYASMWISKAQKYFLDSLENYRHIHKRFGKNFRQTHSLWYDMRYVRHRKKSNGLLEILLCRKCCHTLDSVHARFAAFLSPNFYGYQHKLSVVFKLSHGDTSDYVSLYSHDGSSRSKAEFRKEFHLMGSQEDTGGSDTGNPCPPPNPCNSTTGALLPSPNN
jgi:hypothetical protein